MHLYEGTRSAPIVGKAQNQGLGWLPMWYVRVPAGPSPQSTKTPRRPSEPAKRVVFHLDKDSATIESNNPVDTRVVQTNLRNSSTSIRAQRC